MRLRRYLLLMLTLFTCVLLVGGLARAAARGPQVVSSPSFGVQMQGAINENQGLSAAVAAGTRWVRVTLRWALVEPVEQTPPQYNWRYYDTIFRNAADAGLSLIVTVTGNPDWAGHATDPFRRSCGPIRLEKVSRFASFMADVVRRYGAPPYNIKNWELYNEPDNGNPYQFGDLGGCWGDAPGKDELYPRRYADMLIAVHNAVKTADPQAQIWMGGLAYDFFQPDGPFDPLFLDKVLNRLMTNAACTAKPCFDVFNFHYYPAFRDLWNPFGPDLIGKARYLRSELQRYAINRPVALTEVGRPTDKEGPPDPGVVYSDTLTARYVPKAFARGLAARLTHVIWFTMVDDPSAVYKYGLLRSDGTPKRSYDAYRTTMGQIAGASYLGPVTWNYAVEGYRFSREGREVIAAWLPDFPEPTTPQPPVSLVITATLVRAVSHLGTERYIGDGGPGDGDPRSGYIGVAITDDPIWLEVNPPTPTATPTPTPSPTLPAFTPTSYLYLPVITRDYLVPTPTPTRWFGRRMYLPILGQP